jgi:hypothetical protein
MRAGSLPGMLAGSSAYCGSRQLPSRRPSELGCLSSCRQAESRAWEAKDHLMLSRDQGTVPVMLAVMPVGGAFE